MKAEELVVEWLTSGRMSIHIHCKSHTCENLDKCCINALSKVESQLKITGMKIQRQPRLKSFVNQDVLQFVPLLYY